MLPSTCLLQNCQIPGDGARQEGRNTHLSLPPASRARQGLSLAKPAGGPVAESWVRQTPRVASRAPRRSPMGADALASLQPGVGRPGPRLKSQSSVRPALSDPCRASVIVPGPVRRPRPRKPLPHGAHVSPRRDPGVSPPLRAPKIGSRGCGLMPGLHPHLRAQASGVSAAAEPPGSARGLGGSALPTSAPGWCHPPLMEGEHRPPPPADPSASHP